MEIIFENDNLLIINKPAGILVHGDGKSKEPTVSDWVVSQYPHLANVGEPMTVMGTGGVVVPIVRPGIVHRLDKDTSGALVIAKTQAAFEHLKKQFQDHLVLKTYEAFVYGAPKKDRDTIDAPIGRSPNDFRRYTASRGKRGTIREATTIYSVRARFNDEQGEQFALLSMNPKTGRTHQLRVHAAFMHHPIVSDALYAPKKSKALGFDRQALHARMIELTGIDGTYIKALADYPTDFAHAISRYLGHAS